MPNQTFFTKIRNGIFFSYKFTGSVTIIASLVNIYFWMSGDIHSVFTGYSINPDATMKIITSVSFIIFGCIFFTNNKITIVSLIVSGLLIQCVQFCFILFNTVNKDDWNLSSGITIIMFCIAFLAFFFIKIKRLKVIFLILNGMLYVISSFAVFYYLLDMTKLNSILGFSTLSWNTSILFLIYSISLFEFKLIKRIDSLKFKNLSGKETHPYNYYPFFFLIPILVVILISILTYFKYLTVAQSAFIIILFLSTSSFINMFLYSYNFIKFYFDIKEKTIELEIKNKELNNLIKELSHLNKKINKKNSYLEDFATITSHNLREPIVALDELNKITNYDSLEEGFDKEQLRQMFNTSIQRLNQGINSLVQYHNFIKNEKPKYKQTTSLEKSIEEAYKSLESFKPIDTTLKIDIKTDILFTKNYIDSIFENLFSNSFKYKKKSEPLNIIIIAYKIKNIYKILYRDNGIGIDLNYFKTELFEKRRRFHNQSSTSNGYGLYYTRLFVKKLNGKINIFSKPEKGTAFRIKIKIPHE